MLMCFLEVYIFTNTVKCNLFCILGESFFIGDMHWIGNLETEQNLNYLFFFKYEKYIAINFKTQCLHVITFKWRFPIFVGFATKHDMSEMQGGYKWSRWAFVYFVDLFFKQMKCCLSFDFVLWIILNSIYNLHTF